MGLTHVDKPFFNDSVSTLRMVGGTVRLFSVFRWYENMIGEGPVGIWYGFYSSKENFGSK